MRSALVVGAGGLGCPALLAMAGEVQLTVVDPDYVDVSNLHRQILYRARDVGRLKVDCANERLRARFPRAKIDPIPVKLDESNAAHLIAGHDVVLDGSDSFSTRFLLNDLCLGLGVPLVHGAVLGLMGQLMTVLQGHACYRCIFEAPPEATASCQEAGVIGALCGVIGGWMAQEAAAILERQPKLAGRLHVFDAHRGTSRYVNPRRRDACPAHGRAEVATW